MAARVFNDSNKCYQIDSSTDGVTYFRYGDGNICDIKLTALQQSHGRMVHGLPC